MSLLNNKEPSFHAVLQKKKVLTFLCAVWPGGGYMYLAMMKKGAIMMSLFTAVLGLTLTVGWKFLGFLLPVIWCYCFFDTFHAARLTDAERKAEDSWFFRKTVRILREDPLNSLKERKNIVGSVLLLTALYTVIYGVLLPFFRWGEEFFWVRLTLSVIPTAVVAVLLFIVGKHLLQKDAEEREKKAGLPEMPEQAERFEADEKTAGIQEQAADNARDETNEQKQMAANAKNETDEAEKRKEDAVVEQGAPVFLQERDEALIAEAALASLEEEEKAE